MLLLLLKILLLLLALLITSVLAYALFAPIYLYIHSEREEAGMCWGNLLEGKLIWDVEHSSPVIEVRVPFFHRRIDALAWIEPQKPETKQQHRKKGTKTMRKPNRKYVFPMSRLVAVVKSCRIREFKWNLDTDDFCLNAQLFPLFYLASLRGHQIGINFCGKNDIDLVIQNRLSNMILHFIKPINRETWMQRFIRIF